jgi:hypothetical protein
MLTPWDRFIETLRDVLWAVAAIVTFVVAAGSVVTLWAGMAGLIDVNHWKLWPQGIVVLTLMVGSRLGMYLLD